MFAWFCFSFWCFDAFLWVDCFFFFFLWQALMSKVSLFFVKLMCMVCVCVFFLGVDIVIVILMLHGVVLG